MAMVTIGAIRQAMKQRLREDFSEIDEMKRAKVPKIILYRPISNSISPYDGHYCLITAQLNREPEPQSFQSVSYRPY